MFDSSKHIDNLIARRLSGEASEEELQELNLWMEESIENRKRFEHIQFVDQKAVASHHLVEVNVDKAWNKLHAQMKGTKQEQHWAAEESISRAKMRTQTKRNHQSTISLSVWIRIAAIFILVSGLAVLINQHLNSLHFGMQEQVAIVSADSILEHVLADSSAVTLNRNSQITYEANYGKKERRLALSGEAFFSVKHVKEVPFIVENQNTYIKVTGTSFNIRGNEADSLIEVYVKTGSVLFFTAKNEGVSLVAGETGIFNKNRNTFTKTVTVNENIAAYANHTFVFYKAPLSEVLRQLCRVYPVQIELSNSLVGQCTITVSFNNDDIDTILSIIAETLDLTLSFDNEKYLLEGNECQKEEIEPKK